MKKQRLARHLVEHGCFLYRQGKEHEYWRNSDGASGTHVPRHREIKYGTARAICQDLNIPPPPEK
jgi:predicted RNA binding protein YcfA (HicA-like mRNA interferase family)